MLRFLTDQHICLTQFLSDAPDESCGARATFAGFVRNLHEGKKVKKLHYDCYQTMAEKQIHALIEEVKTKWGIHQAKVIHRIGTIGINEVTIAIAVDSVHRHEAFSACRELIDQIKRQIPIWKHEFYEDGSHEWVYCTHELQAV